MYCARARGCGYARLACPTGRAGGTGCPTTVLPLRDESSQAFPALRFAHPRAIKMRTYGEGLELGLIIAHIMSVFISVIKTLPLIKIS